MGVFKKPNQQHKLYKNFTKLKLNAQLGTCNKQQKFSRADD